MSDDTTSSEARRLLEYVDDLVLHKQIDADEASAFTEPLRAALSSPVAVAREEQRQ